LLARRLRGSPHGVKRGLCICHASIASTVTCLWTDGREVGLAPSSLRRHCAGGIPTERLNSRLKW